MPHFIRAILFTYLVFHIMCSFLPLDIFSYFIESIFCVTYQRVSASRLCYFIRVDQLLRLITKVNIMIQEYTTLLERKLKRISECI